MSDLYEPEKTSWKWFGKMADSLVLSLLWALCCLPVLTIVPASIALYDSIACCVHGNKDHPYKYFFHVLKTELWRGMGMTLLWGALGALLFYGYNLLLHLGKDNAAISVYAMVYLASMLIPLGIFGWLIPLEARFSQGFFKLHKTAATFALVHLPTTALVLSVAVVGAALVAFFPVLVLILPGIVITIQCVPIEKVLQKYVSEEQEESDDDTAE
jgi:uncharacterized membrane protein YesL